VNNSDRPLVSAATRVKEAEALITAIARVVVPTGTITPNGLAIGPTDCTAPYRGQVYWSISRFANIPARLHKTGQDLIPAVQTELGRHGFWVTNDGPGAGFTELRGGNDVVGFSVLGPDSKPLLQFNIDTQCGAP
jgi:hypothetical protein